MSGCEKIRKMVFQEKVLAKLKPSCNFQPPNDSSVKQKAESTKSKQISVKTSTEDKTIPEKRTKIYTVAAKPSTDDVETSETQNESELSLSSKKSQTAKNRKRKLKKKRQKSKRANVSVSFTYNPTTPTNN